jgi:hypothetical protein
MSISTIIALIRDALIIWGLGYILWYVHSSAQSAIRIQDLQAVQRQVEANAQTLAKWNEEARSAEIQRQADMDKVSGLIASNRAPVRLCPNPPGTRPVPGNPPGSKGEPAGSGGSDLGPGEDIVGEDLRPALAAFELKYESALASCRSVLAQWPK